MGFLLFAVTLVVLVHLYLHRRLVHDTLPPGRARRWGAVGLAVAAVLALSAFGLRRAIDPTGLTATVLTYAGFLWLVFALYAAFLLLALEVPRLLLSRGTDPGRRRVLGRALAGLAGLLALGAVGYGVTEARRVTVERRELTLDRLDPALDGVTLAAVSDVHLGPINGTPFLREVVARINAERPDLVAIVGDLVDGTVEELGPVAAELRGLRAPSFFVTGNHEYFSEAEQWCEFLPTLGVRVLRNERVAVGRLGAPAASPTFDLAGIDDRTAARSGEAGHGANLDAALAGRDPSRPVVLLAHQPVMVDQVSRRDVDLQVSGHTHGGQFLPLGYVVLLDQPVMAGLTRVGRTWLYVTRGVGFWGPPVRVGAPPEITLLTLRAPHG